MSSLKIGHRFKGAVPSILYEAQRLSLNFNIENPRDFQPCIRCLALAFNGSKLVEYGYNKKKTHPFTQKLYHSKHKDSIHAEADLVMKLLKDDKIDLITDIILVRGTSQPLNSHPCEICTGLFKMYFANVRLWFYDSLKEVWKCEMID